MPVAGVGFGCWHSVLSARTSQGEWDVQRLNFIRPAAIGIGGPRHSYLSVIENQNLVGKDNACHNKINHNRARRREVGELKIILVKVQAWHMPYKRKKNVRFDWSHPKGDPSTSRPSTGCVNTEFEM